MTKKRSPSGPTGESPKAKKQDSKATPPRQGIQERQGADDANKSVINPNYWYSDGNINTYVTNVIKHKLGGFADDVLGVKCSFRLKNQLSKNNDLYYILYTGAVDSTERGIPLDFFLDKSKQPEPDAGKSDDRKDVFDELNPLLQKQDMVKAKILLPYNITQTHWLTGEIIIEKTSNAISVIIFAHDPYGRGEVSEKNFQILKTALEKRIQEGIDDIPPVNITKEQSPYINSRQQDSNSCGVIVADEIIKRMRNEELPSSPYPPDAAELRRLQLDFLRKTLGEADTAYQNFVTEVTKTATSTSKQHSAEKSFPGSDINKGSELKYYVDGLLNKLFGIEISDNKYANITINDKDGSSQITVCRPQIIGKSVEKMHDVTSYMFIRKALKSQIKDVLDGKAYILNNFIDYILAISKQIQGICLTQDEYNDVKKKILLSKDNEEFFDLSIITKKDNSDITRYLITNKSIIDKLHNPSIDDITESSLLKYNETTAKENYLTQFQRYIKYVFNNLKQMILDSLDTCELTTKFIASIFDPEGYLVEKNNVLFKKILLYRYVWQARDAYDQSVKTLSNKDTFEDISDTEREKIIGETKGPYIRIINDKKAIVERSVQALDIIEQLINHSLYQNNNDKTNNLLSEYNDNYNRDIRELTYEYDESESDDESEPDFTLKDYNKNLSQDNLYKIFHYHAAKALYFVCDFQSLGQGKRILVSVQEEGEETEVVKVHPSATGKGIEQYYIIDKPDIQPEKLITQVIAHISTLLSPFASLRSHASLTNDEEQLSPIQKIFSAFCELLKEDYNLPNILGQQWFSTIQEQFDAKIINSLNEADLLGNNDVQYDLDF